MIVSMCLDSVCTSGSVQDEAASSRQKLQPSLSVQLSACGGSAKGFQAQAVLASEWPSKLAVRQDILMWTCNEVRQVHVAAMMISWSFGPTNILCSFQTLHGE